MQDLSNRDILGPAPQGAYAPFRYCGLCEAYTKLPPSDGDLTAP